MARGRRGKKGGAKGSDRPRDADGTINFKTPASIGTTYRIPAPKLQPIVLPVERVNFAVAKPTVDIYSYQTPQEWLADFCYSPAEVDHAVNASANNTDPDPVSVPKTVNPESTTEATQGVEAGVNQSVESQQNLTTAPQITTFFSLPFDLRQDLYFEAIRPDCKLDFPDHCGLHHNCLSGSQRGPSCPREHGPTQWQSSDGLSERESIWQTWQIYVVQARVQGDYTPKIQPRYSELQFFMFRKVALCIQVPMTHEIQPDDDEAFVASCEALAEQLSRITAAILKSGHLTSLRIVISRAYRSRAGDSGFIDERRHLGNVHDAARALSVNTCIEDILRPLVQTACSKGVTVVAEEETRFRGSWFLQYDRPVGDLLVDLVTAMIPHERRRLLDFEFRMDSNDYHWDFDSGSWLTVPFAINSHQKEIYPILCAPEEERRFNETHKKVGDAGTYYQLLPECRTCYAPFSTWEELKEHLEAKPKHRTSYRTKERNDIHPDAKYGGWIKCHTCAFRPPSQTVTGLETHYRNQPFHRRHAMIPWWKEDNAWWNSDLPMHPRISISFGWTERQKRLDDKYVESRGGSAEDAHYL